MSYKEKSKMSIDIFRKLKNMPNITNVVRTEDENGYNIACNLYQHQKLALAIRKSADLLIMKSSIKVIGASEVEMNRVANSSIGDVEHTAYAIAANKIIFRCVYPFSFESSNVMEQIEKVISEVMDITIRACKKLHIEEVINEQQSNSIDLSTDDYTSNINEYPKRIEPKEEPIEVTITTNIDNENEDENKEEDKENLINEENDSINIESKEELEKIEKNSEKENIQNYENKDEDNKNYINVSEEEQEQSELVIEKVDDDKYSDLIYDNIPQSLSNTNNQQDISYEPYIEDTITNEETSISTISNNEENEVSNDDVKEIKEIEGIEDTENSDINVDIVEYTNISEKPIEQENDIDNSKLLINESSVLQKISKEKEDIQITEEKIIKERKEKEESIKNIEETKSSNDVLENKNILVNDNTNKNNTKIVNKENKKNKDRKEREQNNMGKEDLSLLFIEYDNEIKAINTKYQEKVKALSFDELLKLIENRYNDLRDKDGNKIYVSDFIKESICKVAKKELKSRFDD
jgi:hypothetical protein